MVETTKKSRQIPRFSYLCHILRASLLYFGCSFIIHFVYHGLTQKLNPIPRALLKCPGALGPTNKTTNKNGGTNTENVEKEAGKLEKSVNKLRINY